MSEPFATRDTGRLRTASEASIAGTTPGRPAATPVDRLSARDHAASCVSALLSLPSSFPEDTGAGDLAPRSVGCAQRQFDDEPGTAARAVLDPPSCSETRLPPDRSVRHRPRSRFGPGPAAAA